MTSEALERMCHWRKTMHRLLVSHVKSIWERRREDVRQRNVARGHTLGPGERGLEMEGGRRKPSEAHVHAAAVHGSHVVAAVAVHAVVVVVMVHGGRRVEQVRRTYGTRHAGRIAKKERAWQGDRYAIFVEIEPMECRNSEAGRNSLAIKGACETLGATLTRRLVRA